jgi:hypothetical protein
MPRIFDNIERELLPALQETLDVADRSDFCVGYFNLRGWKQLDRYVEKWSGAENSRCRLLVGMQRLPADELRECLSLIQADQTIDNQTALRLKKKLAEEFRDQLTFGVPTNEDEAGLRRLAAQLKAGKLKFSFHEVDGKQVCRITIDAAPCPVWVKEGGEDHIYLRSGNSTRRLTTREALDYGKRHWKT